MQCRNCKHEQSVTHRDWESICLNCHQLNWIAVGDVVDAKISRTSDFGVFVELAPNIEGLIHLMELAEPAPGHPSEVVDDGDRISARILRIDLKERKIGLSIRRVGRNDITNG